MYKVCVHEKAIYTHVKFASFLPWRNIWSLPLPPLMEEKKSNKTY
jgi:hypothetical protein